jgi:hypothetical protein
MRGDSFIMFCVKCNQIVSDVPWCIDCEERGDITQDEMDAFLLAMPTNWPHREELESYIKEAKARSPHHIIDPWEHSP